MKVEKHLKHNYQTEASTTKRRGQCGTYLWRMKEEGGKESIEKALET